MSQKESSHNHSIVPLNLPPIPPSALRWGDSSVEIYDSLRHKYVLLTPEEWVRQHFTSYMITDKGFPASLMANEVGITLNGTKRRCDTVVFDRTGEPMMIVEYKAPSIPITQKVFDQIVRYNMALQVKFLAVSNGISHYCCKLDYVNHTYAFMPQFPDYAACIDGEL